MARKNQIEGSVTESGTWYKIPEYKVMLVKDSNVPSDKKRIGSPVDVVNMFESYLSGADREHFCIAMLDRKGNLIGLNTVSIGGLHSSVVHPREVFKPAIILGAASIILAHNHPSGDPTPSPEDITVTKKLVKAGRILSIEILDHVIIGDGTMYYSLKEHGVF
jgi:DNA repair protein RadC